MAITTTWTSPAEGGSLDLSTGGTITETWIEQSMSNLNYLGGTAGGAAYHRIAGTVLAGTVASVEFTGIPATFKHLKLVHACRATGGATSYGLTMQFNGDTASNYDDQMLRAYGTSILALGQSAQTGMVVASLPGAAAVAASYGMGETLIPNYTSLAVQKHALSIGSDNQGTAIDQHYIHMRVGVWRTSNAAITQITVLPGGGGTAFATSSEFHLYGVPS